MESQTLKTKTKENEPEMATRKVFSVFDSKAKAFIQPFYSQTNGTAVRQFTAAAQDAGHDFHRFSEDYSLFCLGEFDEESGMFNQPATPEPVVTALAVKELDQ